MRVELFESVKALRIKELPARAQARKDSRTWAHKFKKKRLRIMKPHNE